MNKADLCCNPTSELPASQRAIWQRFFHQPFVWQDRAFQDLLHLLVHLLVQHIPPRLDRELQNREIFGCPHVFTFLCLCNPHLQSRCVDVYLFIFPSSGMLGEGGSAKPTWPSSPGHGHSAPFFCCLSRLPLVTAVSHLSPFLQNFTDTKQGRKRPL